MRSAASPSCINRTTSPTTSTAGERTRSRALTLVASPTVVTVVRCEKLSAALDDRHRHVGGHPVSGEPCREMREVAHAHEHDDRAAEAGERAQLVVVERCVTRDDGEHPAHLAIGHRDADRRRYRDRARDSGDDGDRNPGFPARDDFFTTASEHVRVAALEPHDGAAREGALHHHPLDVVLRHRVVPGGLAHIDDFGAWGVRPQPRLRGEAVDVDDVGTRESRSAGEGEQVVVTGATADERHTADGRYRCRCFPSDPGAAVGGGADHPLLFRARVDEHDDVDTIHQPVPAVAVPRATDGSRRRARADTLGGGLGDRERHDGARIDGPRDGVPCGHRASDDEHGASGEVEVEVHQSASRRGIVAPAISTVSRSISSRSDGVAGRG